MWRRPIYNKKVIIINGVPRGGTNIVWNLLQSHPHIVSPIRETGEILYPKWMSKRPFNALRKPFKKALRKEFYPLLRYVDKKLFTYKMLNLTHTNNKYKNEHEQYTGREIQSALLVIKSLYSDISFTPALVNFFPQSYVISLIRNGVAACEGEVRRGRTPRRTALKYKWTMEEILRQDSFIQNHRIVRFEDCIANPWEQTKKMCEFVNVDPDAISKLRVNRKVLGKNNSSHTPSFNTGGEKVWLSPDEATKFFDTSINERQIQNLASKDREEIVNIIGPTMKRLGYRI